VVSKAVSLLLLGSYVFDKVYVFGARVQVIICSTNFINQYRLKSSPASIYMQGLFVDADHRHIMSRYIDFICSKFTMNLNCLHATKANNHNQTLTLTLTLTKTISLRTVMNIITKEELTKSFIMRKSMK